MANPNDSIGSGSPEVASSPAGEQQPQQLNQLNSSVDSGIAVGLDVDSPSLKLQQRLEQCQRILQVLRRDEAAYQLLRDRLSKISNKKTKKKDDSEVIEESQSTCNVCCSDLDTSSAKNYVKCRTCEKSVCRGLKCADWHPKDGQWECQLCHNSKESLAHTSSWVAEQMSFNQHKFVYPMRARSEVYIPIQPSQDGQDVESTIQFESVSQIGIRNHMNIEERAKIREYVEEIVAEMLGGNLDKIKVGQLSKSENYLPAIVNGHSNNNNNNSNSNHNNNNNGSTCNINGNNEQNDDSSQTRLRTLIETIIAETLRNSALGFNTGASASVSEISLDTRTQSELNALKQRHRTEHYFEPKIYQDLLATAVLNKIADTEGNNRRRSLISESTPDLSGHNNIDENYNAEALSTTSGSSIEPRSDCSLTDNELVLNTGKTDSPLSLQAAFERESVLSDYIAAHMVPLPDFSASVTESEDDNGSVTSSMIADGTWEDNWLFKKKQHSSLQSSATPSSIGMLVPAPRENVRAQIGDRTADEVSDLSEMGSDVEETSLDINDRLLNKHLIGGQNTKLVLDELIDRTSLISHTLPEEHEPAFTEATNPLILQTQPTEVPSQFVEPPPPTTFQDDQHIEEPILIADQNEIDTDEFVDALDEGCTGFSTVEYTEENPPSVIEILAAMALGPMLAVPASEQQGVITPSEMHTLKELSDLALAEINSRTTDLEHHSLDVIAEEENTDLSLQSTIETTETVGFSIIEISEEPPSLYLEMENAEKTFLKSIPAPIADTENTPQLDIKGLPQPAEAVSEEPHIVNPAEAVSEPTSSIAEPKIAPPVDIVDLPQPTEAVSEEQPTVNPAEIAVEPQPEVSSPPATIEAVSEPTSSVAVSEIAPPVDIVDLPQPTEAVSEEQPTVNPAEIAVEPQAEASSTPAPIETVSEPTSSVAVPEIAPPVDIVDLPQPTEAVSEEQPTVNPAEIAVEPQAEASSTPATGEPISEPASSIAEPEIAPPEDIVDLPQPTEAVSEEQPTVNPAEIAVEPQTEASSTPATGEPTSEPASSIAEPEIAPPVDIVDLPQPTEAVSEEQPTVNPAEIAVEPQTEASSTPATVESISEPVSSGKPEIAPPVDIVDLPQPTEAVSEEQPTVNPAEIAVEPQPEASSTPATIEAVSEPTSSVAIPEIAPPVDIVDLPQPTEAVSEEQPTVNPAEIAVEPQAEASSRPAPIETVSEPTSSFAEAESQPANIISPSEETLLILPSTEKNVENSSVQESETVFTSTVPTSAALGSIAEREVKKWYNAVEMPNNPYAPEALKQRISGTQERCMDVPNISPSAEQKALALKANAEDATDRQPQSHQTDYKRYSRDYYINNNNNGTTVATGEKIDVARSGPEDVDIVINEAQNASKTAAEHQQDQEEQSLQDQQKATVYKALPAQILEDANSPSPSPSVESQSNPSLATTTTSEDSDTVRIYDFNKQETTVIKQQTTVEQTVETVESSTYSTSSSYSIDSSVVAKKRERPVVLQFGPGDSAPTIGSPMGTPTRGSTPPAFRFLQPKRRLIEPSQVLSIDQDDQDDNGREPNTPMADKPAVEDDVVHAMPSVKALAQAFLLTSKHTQPQRRWRARHVRIAASASVSAPETPDKPADSPSSNLSRKHRLEHAVSMAEVADESTIASDLSSLETDSSIPSEGGNAFVPPTASPVPVRRGFLRSNIAFFENLKFK
ncbi:mucin-17 isoform X2 [Drosophila willistoni]|uniref:mucin-17 isoform X2 n=1 Tax=Drosophila willistoni TaxID=7260 RepID=UPI000C26CE02|nr:mucin-17 isoform X2 [Drosophila willistoni]